ncbi:hypothetical protein QCA50_015398 [Cerrena zonata]|uniref:Uncharacterized protein n=1 Tax=Cerrena zonata TaxID=2478898 RepID=A0AAW0FRH8_9APHY
MISECTHRRLKIRKVRTKLSVFYLNLNTGSTYSIARLTDFKSFVEMIRTTRYRYNEWREAPLGLVFKYEGAQNAKDSAIALDYVGRVCNYYRILRYNRPCSWVQFIGFCALDFDNAIFRIECLPGRPPNLVFSGCTIGNYQSVVSLADRSKPQNSCALPAITLDKNTAVEKLSASHGTPSNCTPHSLRVYSYSETWQSKSVAKLLYTCPNVKEVFFSLDYPMDIPQRSTCLHTIQECAEKRIIQLDELVIDIRCQDVWTQVAPELTKCKISRVANYKPGVSGELRDWYMSG